MDTYIDVHVCSVSLDVFPDKFLFNLSFSFPFFSIHIYIKLVCCCRFCCLETGTLDDGKCAVRRTKDHV